MNLILEIILPGIPVGKARHRDSKYGGKYDPQSALVTATRKLIKKQLPVGWIPTEQPVLCAFDSYFTRPKSHYRTGRNENLLKKSAPMYHTIKPDYSNLAKFYEDCMNLLVWHDDSQIIGYCNSAKYWISKTEKSYMRVRVYAVKN